MRWFLALLLPTVLLTGCRRPATKEECELIVERVTSLARAERLKETDHARREAIDTAQAGLAEAVRDRCVGKPVTAKALECVKNATSSDAVVACF